MGTQRTKGTDPLVALRMPPELRDALRQEAEAEGLSFSEVVRRGARAWLADRQQEDARVPA